MPADPPTIDAPVLAGSAVRLRAVARDDLPLLRAWRGDPATWALTMGFRGPIMEPGDDAWYAELARRSGHDRVAFAVDELETGSFVGLTQLADIDPVSRTAVFGMQLGPATARGRGLGAEGRHRTGPGHRQEARGFFHSRPGVVRCASHFARAAGAAEPAAGVIP